MVLQVMWWAGIYITRFYSLWGKPILYRSLSMANERKGSGSTVATKRYQRNVMDFKNMNVEFVLLKIYISAVAERGRIRSNSK